MLCFPRNGAHIDDLGERECYSWVLIQPETWVNTLYSSFDDFDGFGTTFKKEPPTQFWHYGGALGNYKGSPFAVGSNHQSFSTQTEILDYEKGKWVRGEDYKFERNWINNAYRQTFGARLRRFFGNLFQKFFYIVTSLWTSWYLSTWCHDKTPNLLFLTLYILCHHPQAFNSYKNRKIHREKSFQTFFCLT